MTAFGQAALVLPEGRFIAEIQSLNRKHQEITLLMPPEFARLEAEIRRQISSQVGRGQITVKIGASYEKNIPLNITPNIALARGLKNAWDQISEALNLSEDRGFKLSMLASREDILNYEEFLEDEQSYRKILTQLINQALEKFLAMKSFEGNLLAQDIIQRLGRLKEWIEIISQKAVGAPQKYREKLIEKLNEFKPGIVGTEDDRLLKEILIYTEKVDIAEEITRFKSHLAHFQHIMESSEFSIGKTLEFIVQELGRETNTIGSKSSDVEIARRVVDIKSELERIREQIQNVE
jgi:uncharacterized protein (TIGR00255 family)